MNIHLKTIARSPILYKLLVDSTLLWTLFACGFFTADFILPGILSLYLPVGVVIGILIILLILIIIIAHLQMITHTPSTKQSYAIIIVLTLITLPLLIIATSNFPLLMRLILITIPILTLFFFARNIHT